MVFPYLQSKTGGPIWPRNPVHSLTWFGSPNNKPWRPWDLFCHATRAEKLIPCLLLSRVPSHHYLVSLTREPRQPWDQSYSLTWAGNQANIHIQLFSAIVTIPPPDLRAMKWPHPKIDPASKPHLPKGSISWHVQNTKLILMVKNCLCRSESAKSGKENHLLKCADTSVRNQVSWQIRWTWQHQRKLINI